MTDLAAIRARIREAWEMPGGFDVLYGTAETVIRDDLYDLLAEVERLREIAKAMANLPAGYNDYRPRPNYCVICDADSMDDITHTPDCPVTKARAVIDTGPLAGTESD